MRVFFRVVLAIATACFGVSNAAASGPSAVAALIDKVVYEPNANDPKTATKVQFHGVFALAQKNSSSFDPPVEGIMYFECSNTNSAALARCRLEWDEIAKTAVRKKCVGFSDVHRISSAYTIHKPGTRPSSPDSYNPRFGLGVQDLSNMSVCKSLQSSSSEPKVEPSAAEPSSPASEPKAEPVTQDAGPSDVRTSDPQSTPGTPVKVGCSQLSADGKLTLLYSLMIFAFAFLGFRRKRT